MSDNFGFTETPESTGRELTYLEAIAEAIGGLLALVGVPQGEVEVVEIILLSGGGDPADLDVFEVLVIVKKIFKSLKRIGGTRVQVFQAGD